MIEAIVDNRWNSTYRAIKSTCRLKEALLKIRDDEDGSPFAKVIPDEDMFAILEDLLPGLNELNEMSEFFCGDMYPTVHMMLYRMLVVQTIVARNNVRTDVGKEYFGKFLEEINTRQPNNGANQKHIRWANVLHPFFKGTLIYFNETKLNVE